MPTYRELQKQCKSLGLSAQGDRATLEARLLEDSEAWPAAPKKAAPKKAAPAKQPGSAKRGRNADEPSAKPSKARAKKPKGSKLLPTHLRQARRHICAGANCPECPRGVDNFILKKTVIGYLDEVLSEEVVGRFSRWHGLVETVEDEVRRDPRDTQYCEFMHDVEINVRHEALEEEWTLNHDLYVASIHNKEYNPPEIHFIAQVAVTEEAGVPIHHGVTCDRSGQCPIIGARYHLRRQNYDLNETEFMKLPIEEQAKFVKF